MNVLDYFIDPLFFAPIVGTLAISLAASLVGVLLVEKKETLVAEVLSHTAYPGILVSVLFMGAFFEGLGTMEEQMGVIIGSGVFCLGGLFFLRFLQRVLRVSQDVSLCLALSLFFGVGVLMASQIQFFFPALYRAVPLYLFGQAVTLTKSHLYFLVPASTMVVVLMFLFYKEWKMAVFDPELAEVAGIGRKKLSCLFYALLLLCLAMGFRACGVLLLSALFVMPAISAKLYSRSFGERLFLAAFFSQVGALAGLAISISFSSESFHVPTGPAIVVFLSLISGGALVFSRRRKRRNTETIKERQNSLESIS